MKILKAGTRIKTVVGGIEGMVTGVCITMDTVEYRVGYFHNGEHKTMWLFRYEMEVSVIKRQAGFGHQELPQQENSEVTLIASGDG